MELIKKLTDLSNDVVMKTEELVEKKKANQIARLTNLEVLRLQAELDKVLKHNMGLALI